MKQESLHLRKTVCHEEIIAPYRSLQRFIIC
jgi:hypothetical protein